MSNQAQVNTIVKSEPEPGLFLTTYSTTSNNGHDTVYQVIEHEPLDISCDDIVKQEFTNETFNTTLKLQNEKKRKIEDKNAHTTGLSPDNKRKGEVLNPDRFENNVASPSVGPYNLNSVEYLKSIKFSKLPISLKLQIKSWGRPTPCLCISQVGFSKNRKYTRAFKNIWYERIPWLCGCATKNMLFCFPCLLFGEDSVWTQTGYNQLNKLKEKCQKHQESRNHVNSVISLATLGKVSDIQETISEAHRLSNLKHNEQVEKNREILSKMIDAIKFCAEYELGLRGHNKTDSSDNPGVFRGILNYQAKHDSELWNHLNNNSAFKETSTFIRNDILYAMLEVCKDEITSEISKSNFLAVMAYDTIDVFEQTQLAIVFRYELHATVYERFWGYFNPEDETADSLSKCILTELQKILKTENDCDKLIAQTYDGASVMSGAKREVQKKIQEVYKYANFIHCYAHQLNLVMKHVTSSIASVRKFFMDISGMPTFFSKSPKRLAVLNKHMTPILTPSSPRLNFSIKTENVVFEYKHQLIKAFEEMVASFKNDKSFDKATRYLALLKNEHFLFWLKVFHKIMPYVDVLYVQMQSRSIDAGSISRAIEAFISAIQKIRNSGVCNSSSQANISESQKVCDRICMECKERFDFTNHLIAAKLFYSEHFSKYKNKLPEIEISQTCAVYPFIVKERLETELSIFYERGELHNFSGLISLLQTLKEENLACVFPETVNLLKLLVTIPMTTSEPERCFSTLKRVKMLPRNTIQQDRLKALSMVSLEKEMILQIPMFNQKVITKFCQKTSRMDFILK